MFAYRLYYCDRHDRVTHFITMESADDAGAIEAAGRLPHRFNKEIWAGARRLAVIPGSAEAHDAAEAMWMAAAGLSVLDQGALAAAQ